MSKKYDIFISYRRDGGIDSAVTLRSTLSQMRYRVFLDVVSLRTGHFDTALLQHIEDCKDFLLVLSPHALDRCVNEDDWVRREIKHAMALGKNIIPIICDGGNVQERLNVPLPPTLADLPRYNVLETNLVQLRAMTQLLRTSLTAKPRHPLRGMMIGAAAAAALCLIGFFAAGQVQRAMSVFPRTAAQKNLVAQAVNQQGTNLVYYNVAHDAYLRALDNCLLYLSGSPQVTRSAVRTELNFVLDTLEKSLAGLQPLDDQVMAALLDSPLPMQDLDQQDEAIRLCLEQMAGIVLSLEYGLLDETFCTDVSKKLWISCYRDMAVLDGEGLVLGVNAGLMALSGEALHTLRTQSLPMMTSIYNGQAWLTSEADVAAREESLYRQQLEVLQRLEAEALQDAAILENTRRMQQFQERMRAQTLADIRREEEELRATLEQLQAELYEVYKPLPDDTPDALFVKAVLFMRMEMLPQALDAFSLFGQTGEPNAQAIALAAANFAIYRPLTDIHHGLIVSMYAQDAPPQPEIQIGDIIYAVNGQEVADPEDYIAAKGDNAASAVQVLRFTDAGYEKLSIRLDPQSSLLHLMALEYE